MMAMTGGNLRVLHFAGTYLPVPGGTTRRLQNMLASPENEHVLFVPWPSASQCPAGANAVRAEESQGHIHIRRVAFPQSGWWSTRFPLGSNLRRARKFVKRAESETADILHGHNPLACALASLHFKRQHALPMVYEVHGIMQDADNLSRAPAAHGLANRVRCGLLRRLTARFERQVLRAADRLIVQTGASERRLMELYGLKEKPINVIRNGVDPQAFDPTRWQSQRSQLRHQHRWDDHVVCLYAGYLNPVNGIDFLLEALPRLTGAVRRRIKIVLLGRGPLEHAVGSAADQHRDLMEYRGLVQPDEMPAYYAACDVFLIPRPSSLPGETLLPMKLLEAMAMKKTLLVSNVAAMAEVITDGQNGLVFENGDSDDFLRKLATVAERNGELEALGCRARQDVLDKYTWEASRQQLQSVYETLLPT